MPVQNSFVCPLIRSLSSDLNCIRHQQWRRPHSEICNERSRKEVMSLLLSVNVTASILESTRVAPERERNSGIPSDMLGFCLQWLQYVDLRIMRSLYFYHDISLDTVSYQKIVITWTKYIVTWPNCTHTIMNGYMHYALLAVAAHIEHTVAIAVDTQEISQNTSRSRIWLSHLSTSTFIFIVTHRSPHLYYEA